MFPQKVAQWFSIRGITQETLKSFNVWWNGKEIVIPIKDEKGKTLFNKYRRDPESTTGPKYKYDSGSKISLYNPTALEHEMIIICEGELDAIRLESLGYHAISSTGGASSFQKDWISLFDNKQVYICFDTDSAGIKGAIKLYTSAGENSHFHLVQFPAYFPGKDVTDFLQHHTKEEFDFLLESAIKPDKQPTKKTVQSLINKCADTRFELKSKDLSTDLLEEYLEYLNDIKTSLKKKKIKEKILLDIEGVKGVSVENFLPFNPAGFTKCIWHDEKSPSMKFYPKTNSVYCFGQCGKAGDVISVVQTLKGCTFKEAVEILKTYL